MALFSRKTKKDLPAVPTHAGQAGETKAEAPKETKAVSAPATKADLSHVLQAPRITEKATMYAGSSVYVFDVATSANKKQIASAVQAIYNVKPRQVRIVNIRSKIVRNMRTGKSGVKQGGKKAYVYLKKGETITIS